MGDVGEDFKFFNELKKERKANNKNKNMEVIENSNIKYCIDQNGTVLIKVKMGTVCFYPTTNKFLVKGKVYYGNAKNCLGFIKNREG